MTNQEQKELQRDRFRDLVEAGEFDRALELLLEEHPADQADLIEQMPEDIRGEIIRALSPQQLGEILEFLNEELRADLLAGLPADVLVPVLDQVDEDVAADIVQDLSEEQQAEVVPLLEDSASVRELMSYEENTAGGRMSPDFVAVHRDWTVDEAIQFLRRQSPDDTHPFYLYVVDDEQCLTGTVSLRALVTAAPETPIAAISREEDVFSVRANEDQEVVAERMRHYNLLALPVIDGADHLLGVITSDDILDVQVEEATEDIFRMAGVGVKEWAFSPVWESARRRIPWLSFNMAWSFASAGIISLFTGTIGRVEAIVIFMPMIAGQAGNAGIQTATIVVRSMALGEVQTSDLFRLLRKEWMLGTIKGTIFGCVLGLIASVWQDNTMLGVVAGVSMFLNMFVASTTGVILPITLRRLGIDPATIAGVFDTMITDFMGFLIYLGLATILVSRLT